MNDTTGNPTRTCLAMTEKKAHRPGGCVATPALISKYLLRISWVSPRVDVAQKVSKFEIRSCLLALKYKIQRHERIKMTSHYRKKKRQHEKREDDNTSNLERVGDEGILRNELGESQLGSISAPITPLQIFVLANVAFALRAAPDKREKLLFLGIFPGRLSNPLGTRQEQPSWALHS
uniref:Uncharacterized protein n=1 Tax=Salix viminalis TaxID=40686 RepID=A0A6N2KFP5_SALVM